MFHTLISTRSNQLASTPQGKLIYQSITRYRTLNERRNREKNVTPSNSALQHRTASDVNSYRESCTERSSRDLLRGFEIRRASFERERAITRAAFEPFAVVPAFEKV
ncbi:hypothetical protein GW17_00042574 [Ensete ventricosum]|nr:hypothetical protein GW17_00042574 [Ensete ventricosum]RZS21616.1 hypothetical protein BHM03_00054275 [Ensete ventricosum]